MTPHRSDEPATNLSEIERKRERLRQLLEARLQATDASQEAALSSVERVPLSVGQRALWFQYQLHPTSDAYNITSFFPLPLGATAAFVHQALGHIIERHPPLRSTFGTIAGEPVCDIHPPGEASLEVIKTDDWTLESFLESVRSCTGVLFDLEAGPPIRAHLFTNETWGHRLLIVIHHIIGDSITLETISEELSQLIQASINHTAIKLPCLTTSYADFVENQNKRITGQGGEQLWSYWQRQFPDGLPRLDLHPEDAGQPQDRSVHTFIWSDGIHRRIKAFQKEAGTTSFVTFLAAFSILLQRYTQQDSIPVGTAAHGRTRTEYKNLVGYFVNPVLLGLKLTTNLTFIEWVRQVETTLWGAMDHQEFPYPLLVERLSKRNQIDRSGFQVLFMHQDTNALQAFGGRTDTPPQEEPPPSAEAIDYLRALYAAKMQRGGDALLYLDLLTERHTITGGFAYDTRFFSANTIIQFEHTLHTILETVLESPNQPISSVGLIHPDEARQRVDSTKPTPSSTSKGQCVHTHFRAQVQQTPEAIALEHGENQWTYAELDTWSTLVAHTVTEHLDRDDPKPVILAMHRSPELIASMLGVLKAGTSYLPIDVQQPAERVQLIAEDTGSPLVLTTKTEWLNHDIAAPIVYLEDLQSSKFEAVESASPPAIEDIEQAAHILYTSGSTGTPKGVVTPHRAIVHLVMGTEYASITSSDRVAHASNPAFDAATFEVWGALLNGATLVILDPDVVIDPQQLAISLRQRHITTAFFTTALFNLVAERIPDAFQSLDRVLVGGERMDPASVRRVLDHGPPAALLNAYGPTECTTFSTWYRVEKVPKGTRSIPIGRPVSKTELYVVDPYGHLVPDGFPGELYIGGPGVGLGYLNRPNLSREVFIPSPFHTVEGGTTPPMLYKTGDLVRRQPDGNLVFLDRIDRQVKIRGFRIEPGEIETVLRGHQDLAGVALVVHEPPSTGRQLIAFCVPADDKALDSQDLRAYCAEHLPSYMIPARFISEDVLPLTPNGKMDYKALLDRITPLVHVGNKAVELPHDDIERQLISLYEELLDLEGLDRDAHFFHLGGHSLLATRLVARIEQTWGLILPLHVIFSSPEIVHLANVIRGGDQVAHQSSAPSLQQGDTPFPLFLIPGAGGGPSRFIQLLAHLREHQPCYVLQGKGRNGIDHPHRKIDEMTAYAIATIKAVQPSGPYKIAGYSAGGVLAFEVACALQQQGDEVSFLGLMDTCSPQVYRLDTTYKSSLSTPLLTAILLLREIKRALRPWKYYLLWHIDFYRHRSRGEKIPLRNISMYMMRVMQRVYARYKPGIFEGHLTLFRTNQYPDHFPEQLGWASQVLGKVNVHIFDSSHHDLLNEPIVQNVATSLLPYIVAEQEKPQGHADLEPII